VAHDLLLGSSNRDWSRDVSGSEADSLNLTDAEKDRIERLAKLQMLAVRGDVEALKKVAQVNAALTALQIKAKKGDARSKRIIETLLPTGLVQRFAATSKKGVETLALAGDESGAWLHKLNPRYWLKSKDERRFEDIERDMWVENAKLNKKLSRRQVALEQGFKAQQAAEAVNRARAQSADTDAQINALSASLRGDIGFNGHQAYMKGINDEEMDLALDSGPSELAALRRRRSQ
jgi:hypothetical protein